MSWLTADELLPGGGRSWRRADAGLNGVHAAPADADAHAEAQANADVDGDAQLVAAACAGDEPAFVALYRRWQGPIYRFSLHMSGSESLAEDVTQEVFVALAQDGHRFDERRGRFSSYLFAIAANLVRRRLRREGIYEPIGDDERSAHARASSHARDEARGTNAARGTATVGAGMDRGARTFDAASVQPDVALDRRELVQAVRRAVCALPVAFREAIVLCDLQELSYAEAAAVLGCPVGTVRSRLHRGRGLLAARLAAGRARVAEPQRTPAANGGEP